MDTAIVQATAHYVEAKVGPEAFRFVSAVVANCKMLALELEAQDIRDTQAQETQDIVTRSIDHETLLIAAYLHDISTPLYGFQDHQHKSAEMAVAFLHTLDIPEARIRKIEETLLAHTTVALTDEQRIALPIESRILYDADKLGRLSGLSVVTSLIELGARYPNRAVTGEMLTAILRHVEERFVELYQSLNTAPARDMAKDKFGRTLAFLDGVIEHLSDATPV